MTIIITDNDRNDWNFLNKNWNDIYELEWLKND